MANLNGDGEEGVSLFPMFNILACTLGVMVFILATVATVSLGADKAVEFIGAEIAEEPDRAALWADWNGNELVMLPSMATATFEEDLAGIPTFEATYSYMFDQLAGSPAGAELASISLDQDNRYVVLLVRPSGFETIPEIRGYLDLLGIQSVVEPIEQTWRRIRVR